MKIKNVITHIIQADLSIPFKFSQGYCYKRGSVIVEVIGADGTSGFGECMCHGQQPPQLAASFIENCYKDLVIGENSLDVEVLWEKIYNKVRPFGQQGIAINALSGLDIALWDLNGKELGKSVSRLMGGRFREKVTAYATGFYRKADGVYPRDAISEALAYVEAGFKGMKLKVGFLPEVDIEYIRAVRQAVGFDILLMADFNYAYNQAIARRIILELEPEKLHFFEEIITPEDIQGYKAIRNLTSSYIAAGECMFGKIAMKDWLEQGALDIYQPDLCSSGGFTECKKMASLAQAYNTMLIPHVWGSGIGLAASLQFISNLANTPMADSPVEPLLEYDRSSHPFRLDLINDGLVFKDGALQIPDAPGIGVEVNHSILKKYKVN